MSDARAGGEPHDRPSARSYLDAMKSSSRWTAKVRSYGALYDHVIATLPPAPTVLEIGVANGGSLQTWRALLGPQARIIGVDLNERARLMEHEGFEILLLDTGLAESWRLMQDHLKRQVDLLVDDGGHTNRQQISTLRYGTELVRDGGWLVIEDLHASFMAEFGNPSAHSTARFLNEVADDLHRRHPRSEVEPRRPNLAGAVQHLVVGMSWAGLRIDRRDYGSTDEVTAGQDQTLMDYDHRWDGSLYRHLDGRMPRRLTRLLRYRHLLAARARRLFRGDAREL